MKEEEMHNETFPYADREGREGRHGGGRGGHGHRHGHGHGAGSWGDPYSAEASPWPARGWRRGGSRLALLALLKEGPRTTAQLSQALAERGHGRLLLTPGLLPAALQQLQAAGLVRGGTEPESGYELTEAGTQYLDQLGPLSAGPADPARIALRQAIVATAAAATQVARDGGQDETAQAAELLNETRRKLYRLLAGDAVSTE
jgi:DNA-binding PadR family transcriptional regulator